MVGCPGSEAAESLALLPAGCPSSLRSLFGGASCLQSCPACDCSERAQLRHAKQGRRLGSRPQSTGRHVLAARGEIGLAVVWVKASNYVAWWGVSRRLLPPGPSGPVAGAQSCSCALSVWADWRQEGVGASAGSPPIVSTHPHLWQETFPPSC